MCHCDRIQGSCDECETKAVEKLRAEQVRADREMYIKLFGQCMCGWWISCKPGRCPCNPVD
mgnify:FL=1